MRTNIKPSNQHKSLSSDRLWSPAPSQIQLGTPVAPRPNSGNTSDTGLQFPTLETPIYKSLPRSKFSTKKLEGTPLPTNKSSHNTPSLSVTSKFPFTFKDGSNAFMTLPARTSSPKDLTSSLRLHDSSIKCEQFIEPQDNNVLVKTPQSPNRDDYNKYRSSSTSIPSSPTVNFNSPNPPLPKTMTLLRLSKPSEFKIQRPKLSLADSKLEQPSMVKLNISTFCIVICWLSTASSHVNCILSSICMLVLHSVCCL